MRKINYTTIEAINKIAKYLRITKRRFGFSGNKDKNAITEQYISIRFMDQALLKRLESFNYDRIKLKLIGYSDKPITLGTCDINEFDITLRELKKKPSNEIINHAKKYGFVNYFGEQRFGCYSNTHLIGKAIIEGDFKKAVLTFLNKEHDDWKQLIKQARSRQERSILDHLVKHNNDLAGALRKLHKNLRRLFIHAYQSYIWNKVAVIYLKNNFENLIEKDYCLGKMLFLADEKPVYVSLPLIGYNIYDNESKNILKSEGIEINDFKLKSMPEIASEGSFRALFVKPVIKEVFCSDVSGRILFDLPKGAYATVLLRKLFC